MVFICKLNDVAYLPNYYCKLTRERIIFFATDKQFSFSRKYQLGYSRWPVQCSAVQLTQPAKNNYGSGLFEINCSCIIPPITWVTTEFPLF